MMGTSAASAMGFDPVAQTKAFLAASGMSIEALATAVGYARPTLSRYLSGKYPSTTSGIERKLVHFLEKSDPMMTQSVVTLFPSVGLAQRTDFFESADAKNIIGIFAACQEQGRLGTVMGKSGFGKSVTAEYFGKMPRVALVKCRAVMGHRDLIREIEHVLGIPKSYGSICERLDGIIAFFEANPGYLLIVDEADKLLSKNTQTKMDTLRDLFDSAKIGLVLLGEPRLKSLIAHYLDRMENRIAYQYEMGGLSPHELDDYLKEYEIEAPALLELRRRACGREKSCFRLLDLTLTNVCDILMKRGSNVITLDVIEQASNWMPL